MPSRLSLVSEAVNQMWREFIQSFTSRCDFSGPASLAEIAEVEQKLGVTLPDDLRNLLQETNGAVVSMAFLVGQSYPGDESDCCSLVWSTGEILEENLNFREFDECDPPMFESFTPLLFFASIPNGDPVAFRGVNGGVTDPAVVAMSHENYGDRWEVAASLRDYLTMMLQPDAPGPDVIRIEQVPKTQLGSP